MGYIILQDYNTKIIDKKLIGPVLDEQLIAYAYKCLCIRYFITKDKIKSNYFHTSYKFALFCLGDPLLYCDAGVGVSAGFLLRISGYVFGQWWFFKGFLFAPVCLWQPISPLYFFFSLHPSLLVCTGLLVNNILPIKKKKKKKL